MNEFYLIVELKGTKKINWYFSDLENVAKYFFKFQSHEHVKLYYDQKIGGESIPCKLFLQIIDVNHLELILKDIFKYEKYVDVNHNYLIKKQYFDDRIL